ncbi:hypothetical protein KY290_017182 [Solanum tuberosum]|uniref:Uncharacterized protein n=1 Tax=Solanum tuberosum TaxID=4113 RepID=A0ABQ7VC62_SOLTU|nr:hypothetical protein KY284_016214 [Solanum tuberosum]KAH0701941.1 hypothetical protein KY285_016219 [Solanum tuberosum]KAH0761109.1 hypothetical protein KY290_017182 [Solanum tuberosum]
MEPAQDALERFFGHYLTEGVSIKRKRLDRQETGTEIYKKIIHATEKKIKENSIPLARWFESFVVGFELSSEFLLW